MCDSIGGNEVFYSCAHISLLAMAFLLCLLCQTMPQLKVELLCSGSMSTSDP